MKIDLTLKNYRCFPETKPARLTIDRGFTAFLGINNSGKSTLLKSLFEFRNLFQQFHRGNESAVVAALAGRLQTFSFPATGSDNEEMFWNQNQADIEVRIAVKADGAPKELVLTVPRATNNWRVQVDFGSGPQTVSNAGIVQSPPDQPTTWVLQDNGKSVADLTAYLQATTTLANTRYIGAFRNAINIGSMGEYFDIPIGQLFISQWRGQKTGGSRRQNEAAYRLTEDIRHIFGFKQFDINPTADDQTLQLFIDGRSYRLAELGSGLAQFILVLANAAMKRPAYILIDEPELNLHPSLQIDFLTTLASYAQEGILFATHSYGLARATGERIYTVRRGADGASTVVPLERTPRLSELLGELSFGGYQDFGFAKVLLVEGATEVKTVQQFLRQLGKDHQVVLLPMGGSQLIKKHSEAELLEVKRICNDVSALIDSERSVEGAVLGNDRQDFEEVCRRVGIRCHVLKHRAMENYLTDAAVKRVKGDKYRALAPYEDLRKTPFPWAKSENWQIAREMPWEDVKGTDLGSFLEAV